MMFASMAKRREALRWLLAVPLAAALPRGAAAALPAVVVWKDPSCGCCESWVAHLRAAGFSVTIHDTADMPEIKQARGVPDALQSCHTAVAGGYVLEGHVPADDVKRLLAQRPKAIGLAVPGMPQSAPGMGDPGEPFAVVLFGGPGGDTVFAQY